MSLLDSLGMRMDKRTESMEEWPKGDLNWTRGADLDAVKDCDD